MSQNTPPAINGALVINKAPGMTSHDCVAIARRQLNFKKIGHCGTLDPMATGVLVLVLGKATKLQDPLMSEEKVYSGSLKFGEITGSQDKESDIVETRPVPADLDEAQVHASFAKFMGDFEQTPPMVSAIKRNGVPLYKLARKGIEVERKPRPISVYEHSVENVSLPEVDFKVRCSKGFYVRTYAHDIGLDIGCGAHLTALSRLRSGSFTIEEGISVEDLKTGERDWLISKLLPLSELDRRIKEKA